MVMCAVFGCGKRTVRDVGISFFRFPRIISNKGSKIEEITKRRQNTWLTRLNRADLTEAKLKHSRVCSLHFIKVRAYSDEVFSKHKTLKKSIDEDCMMWFLNPHVKKVTLPGPFHSERVIQQLKLIGSGITMLNLHNSKVSENELISVICCLRHVVNVDLSGTSCSDKTLACMRKSCPNLESLNVSSCGKLTDRGMKNLCGSKLSLKNLNVLYSGVKGFGIATILNRMPSLECVKYDDLIHSLYQIGKNKQYNLTELMYNDYFEDSMKVIRACIRMCPKLKKLHFVHPVPEKVLKECTKFKNLEELKIKMSHEYYNLVNVDDVLTPILPLSKNLKTLILSCVEISALTLIESFKNLENLYLKKVSFTPFKKDDVKVTTTNLITLVMKDIDMEVNDATYEAIALLISFSKNVTKLHLNYIKQLPSEIFDVILQSMRSLTQVNFEYTTVKMHSLNQLFEIPSLVTLMANCYENQEDYSAHNFLAKRALCTLSWNGICDFVEDISLDHDANSDNKYFYDDDSDESDIISDQCNSTDSESDDRYSNDDDDYYYDDGVPDGYGYEYDYDYDDPYGWY